MRYLIFQPVPVLVLTVFFTTGCSHDNPGVATRPTAKNPFATETITARRCYRNEYPFEDAPDHKDVQLLTITINGDIAVGQYNWLPAFKDKRLGQFEGVFDGKSVAAAYKYTQEGQSGTTPISINLERDHAVIEGGNPDLGLNATIAQVEC